MITEMRSSPRKSLYLIAGRFFLPAIFYFNQLLMEVCKLSIYTDVKTAVSARDAAEFYGFNVKKNGMMCCPFHDDRHPSMKVDKRFYCFGCEAKGDVIDFVARIFHLSPYEAAQKLADDFHLKPRPPESAANTPESPDDQVTPSFRWNNWTAFDAMHKYELMLAKWKQNYAPSDRDEEWDEHFVAALQTLPFVSDWTDQLASSDQLTRDCALHDLLADGTLDQVRSFLTDHGIAVAAKRAA